MNITIILLITPSLSRKAALFEFSINKDLTFMIKIINSISKLILSDYILFVTLNLFSIIVLINLCQKILLNS